MADKTPTIPVTPVAKVIIRKFPGFTPGAFPSTADTVRRSMPAQLDEPVGNVTPLSWWRRMIGKKAG